MEVEQRIAGLQEKTPQKPGQMDIEGIWAAIEKRMLDTLRSFYMAFYDNRPEITAEAQHRVSELLSRMDIRAVAITLNRTPFDERFHKLEAPEEGPEDAPALAVLRVVEPGYIRKSTDQPIRKARVITNTQRPG